MRKLVIRTSLVFALASLIAGAALAQQAEPERFVVVSYIKVLPGQDDAYRDYLATTGKKVFQELMAANPNFVAWSVARVMYSGVGEGIDYDYVGASVYVGAVPEPGMNMDPIAQKAAGMSNAELQRKLTGLRTIIGTEVLRRRAGTGALGTFKEGDFRVVNRIKLKDNMGSEYFDMIQNMSQPMMQARVAAGELKGWSTWSRVFPAGAATTYDVLGVTYWKDLASAIKGLDPAKGVEAFTKALPGKNYAEYISNARDYSQLQQRAIMQVIALVERPAR
jgi:hypothetical protein